MNQYLTWRELDNEKYHHDSSGWALNISAQWTEGRLAAAHGASSHTRFQLWSVSPNSIQSLPLDTPGRIRGSQTRKEDSDRGWWKRTWLKGEKDPAELYLWGFIYKYILISARGWNPRTHKNFIFVLKSLYSILSWEIRLSADLAFAVLKRPCRFVIKLGRMFYEREHVLDPTRI